MALADSRSAAYTQWLSAASALNSFERSASVSVLLSAYDLRRVGEGHRAGCGQSTKNLLQQLTVVVGCQRSPSVLLVAYDWRSVRHGVGKGVSVQPRA
jgi:hypothetical protein